MRWGDGLTGHKEGAGGGVLRVILSLSATLSPSHDADNGPGKKGSKQQTTQNAEYDA